MANSALDPYPAIPSPSALSPQDEAAFQAFMAFDPNVRQWRNGFQSKYGEQPNMADPSFDYRQAYMAGNKPQPYANDTMMHWDSRGKAANHPTAWMQKFYEQNNGQDPVTQSQMGFTPAQSQMVNQQLSTDLLGQLLQRIR